MAERRTLRQLTPALPAAVLGNGSLLASFSERGRIEGVWSPPDRRLDVETVDVAGELVRQEYVGATQRLRTVLRDGNGHVVIEDVVDDDEPLLLRRVTRADGSVNMYSYPRATRDGYEARVDRPATRDSLYERSLLVFDALSDRDTGAVIAAPEVDPEQVHSGGYGFVWARDLAFIVLALLAAGRLQHARRALLWFPRAQEPDGLWLQRHFTDGSVAPGWCAHQLDETASVLFAYEAAWRELHDEELDGSLWPSARNAADFLLSAIDDEGLPVETADLWEERTGRHAYTAAAIVGGLRAAAAMATRHDHELRQPYAHAANTVADALDRYFWSEREQRYLRTLDDPVVDASLLGLAWPFAAVEPAGERMRATGAAVEKHLGRAGGGLMRYERDTYAGGNSWVLAVLWLGLWRRQIGDTDGHARAVEYADRVATPLNLLAEQVTDDGQPAWVLPLAWSHAMYVLAARPELSLVRASPHGSARDPAAV